ncbi:MAG: hypothetical protein H7A39_06910 [Chlamydiales bacterium]|nr:hypothetical protein [Chlamydiales bacterium]
MSTAISKSASLFWPGSCGETEKIFSPYSSQTVNNLTHVNTGILCKTFSEVAAQLLQIVDKYNLEHDIAVWRVHRHFDIEENQQLVSTYDEYREEIVTHVIETNSTETIPMSFTLDQNKNWCPVQYWAGPRLSVMRERYEKLKQNQKFLDEYAQFIAHRGHDFELGIALRQDNLFKEKEGYSLTEGTREDFKYQAVKHVKDTKLKELYPGAPETETGVSITHWARDTSGPRTVDCRKIKCTICTPEWCCFNHWGHEPIVDKYDFPNIHIPRFFQLVESFRI